MFFALRWIVRPKCQVEKVLAVHPFMHHKVGVQGRALPRLEGRRTDDSLGRSAAFNRAHGRGRI